VLKANLKRGNRSLVDLIADPPPYLVPAHALDVIMALPRYGPMRAAVPLERCRVSPGETIGGLTERQRRALLRALEQ
jgi:hypothetical protein